MRSATPGTNTGMKTRLVNALTRAAVGVWVAVLSACTAPPSRERIEVTIPAAMFMYPSRARNRP